MANIRTTRISGINEVGAVRTGADVSFGETTPAGAQIAYSGTDREFETGMSTWLQDLVRQADRVQVTVPLAYADLINLREILGLPASALTGDLQSASDEILAIVEGELGSREDELYLISPGPGTTRRYEFHRTKLRANQGNIQVGRDNDIVYEGTWEVLKPSSGNIVTVTDFQ